MKLDRLPVTENMNVALEAENVQCRQLRRTYYQKLEST